MEKMEATLLQDAFYEFSKASDSIINYYNILEHQIKQLKEEVERKNRELEEAREYLNNILDSLPVGVIVTDKKTVLFSNRRAERFEAGKFLAGLNGDKDGEIKNGKGYYRWKKEGLTNGFSGREVFVFEDVTEFEKMKERLHRDERLRAMGEMAARIAHEIKNPLASMELFLSMLLKQEMRAKERKYAQYVQFGTKTIDRIINNLLSYTRPKSLVFKEARLCEVVGDTLDFMSISLKGREIEIRYDVRYEGPSRFDPDLIKLVVMNLISNAMEAIGTKGILQIGISREGDFTLFAVCDSGCGMSEEVRQNIFNPFFTTKDKGVGLGLFIVYNIIKAHGGYVEVESSEGAGSTFSVYLPGETP